MSANYAFMVAMARETMPPGARVLDFGAGGGEVVRQAAAAGFDAWGVDTYEGVWTQYADGESDRVKRIAPGEPLPFDDASFDGVLTNQVLEHVEDLAAAARELARVVRPGGVLIACFPTREIWREPHFKAWFIHRFAPGSTGLRRALIVNHLLRQTHAPGMPREPWMIGVSQSLVRDMHYRTIPEVLATLAPAFRLERRAEAEFAAFRLRRFGLAWLGRLLAPVVLRLAGPVLVLRRTEA